MLDDKKQKQKKHEQKQPEYEQQIKELTQELEKVKQQLYEVSQQRLRAVADYQNLEKRLEKEHQDWIKFANINLLTRILEVADNLDRAAAFIKDAGLEMVRSNLKMVLKEFGVEEIEVLDKEFDHMTMEAVDKKDGKENHVIEVVQKGYTIHEKVLRPAKVIVGSEMLKQ